jgi:hypothetical protein
MVRQWVESSWSSRTWPKWPAHVGLGQPPPGHQPPHTPSSPARTPASPCSPLWLDAPPSCSGFSLTISGMATPVEICILMLYSILQFELVLAVSRIRPQPRNLAVTSRSGHHQLLLAPPMTSTMRPGASDRSLWHPRLSPATPPPSPCRCRSLPRLL